MEVTKSNFNELLPKVKESIDEADFIAIDTELTGLYASRCEEHAFDSMAERYMKIREHCSKFLIIQFGLSTFKFHPEKKIFTHRDYNFYVFPRPHIRQAPDPRFLCQTSSLHFLASHGFDFNKVIYEGIPYLTLGSENKLRGYLTKKYDAERGSIKQTPKANGQKPVEIPGEHKKFIADINQRVDAFIADESQTVMQLEPCNSFLRKLIYDTVQQKHKTGLEMSSKVTENSNQRYITILKCSEEDKLNKLDVKEVNDLDDLDSEIGFRKVMDYLSESKKLIIGHQMYLDIFHMIEQFFFPLPEDLKEFKSMVRMTFPHLLDTKVLASSDKIKPLVTSTGLGDLFRQFKEDESFEFPTLEVEEGFKGYTLDSEAYHEAGYDAFLAGLNYLVMNRKLGSLITPKVEYLEPSSKVLSRYVNKFFIRQHFDITTLNLSGLDPEPDRNHVFYVSFPEEWKTVDLVELFLPYGHIYVHWLDDVSALVALKNPQNALKVKTSLLNKSNRLYRVKLYSEYQKWALQQLQTNKKEENKKTCPSDSKPSVSKRKNSGGAEGSSVCSMDLIPEDDENEAETADCSGDDLSFLPQSCPRRKKGKRSRKKTKQAKYHQQPPSLKKKTAGNPSCS